MDERLTSAALASTRDPPPEPDLAAENIQARIRGNLMMALSNQHGWLVLTTGNKSEMSVGYATLYGDMAGGFAAIKDVPKTLVYELVAAPQRAGRAGAGAGLGDRAPALGRAAPRPARQRLAAPLRPARPHPRGLRRARPGPRGDDRRRACRPRSSTRWSGWSTAPSTSAARRRPGSGSRRGPSAATGACRSPTASAASPSLRQRPARAMVIWARAQRRSSVVADLGLPDPGGAAAVAGPGGDFGAPSVTGRMKLTLIDWPIAAIPSSMTASAVAREQTLSTRVDITPPCRRPTGWRSSSRTAIRARACSGSSSSHSVPTRASKWERSFHVGDPSAMPRTLP